MVSFEKLAWREGLSNLAARATVTGANLALGVPGLREFLVERLLGIMGTSYDECEEDLPKLTQQQWFAAHLRPFLYRLIQDRPAAARAILRFLGTWIEDVYRRTREQRTGRVAPCTVVIEPTDRCNFSCPGCYAKSTREGSDLPYGRLVDIVQQVVDMGVTLVTLSGGEPFLRERSERAITRLAEQFSGRGFLVYTNGSLIDDEIADRIARVGNVFPAVSVEGFEHQTDARRGAGVYRQNRRTRHRLAERGAMCGFSATVTRENCESICDDAFIDLRIEEGDMFGWFFLIQPIGRAPRADLMVTADQREMLRETINRWRAEDRPIFLGDFWNDGPIVGGCIAGGRYYFHIYANGDISPCVFSPIACGNVMDIVNGDSEYASLDDFVQRHPVFRAFRAEQEQIHDRNRPCLLIDHPECFRRIESMDECRRAKNFPEGYTDGEIGRIVTDIAAEWEARSPMLPPISACGRDAGTYVSESAPARQDTAAM